MANVKKKGLGKGLGALINSSAAAAEPAEDLEEPVVVSRKLSDGAELIELDPHDIEPNPQQPRQIFDEDALQELAESIRQNGVQQPIVVRLHEGAYQLVSGERRVRASILAERAVVPAVVREISDREMLRLGLIENIQREDLNPIETAQAYERLIQEFGWTQKELASQVGKQRVTVTNTLRLLNLHATVQDHVVKGDITMGHARALLALESADRQRTACRKIIEEGLSVRQTERLVNPGSAKGKTATPTSSTARDPHVAQVEDDLRRRFGTKVHLRSDKNNRGKIEIEFFNLDDLERILEMLKK